MMKVSVISDSCATTSLRYWSEGQCHGGHHILALGISSRNLYSEPILILVRGFDPKNDLGLKIIQENE